MSWVEMSRSMSKKIFPIMSNMFLPQRSKFSIQHDLRDLQANVEPLIQYYYILQSCQHIDDVGKIVCIKTVPPCGQWEVAIALGLQNCHFCSKYTHPHCLCIPTNTHLSHYTKIASKTFNLSFIDGYFWSRPSEPTSMTNRMTSPSSP